MKYENPKLNNAKEAFSAIPNKGQSKCMEGPGDILVSAKNHIQGIAAHLDTTNRTKYFITHSTNKDHGKIYIFDAGSTKYIEEVNTDDGYNHPGGCQVIGDFLIVGLENENNNKSKIKFYKIKNQKKDGLELLPFDIIQNDRGCGAAGITAYEENGQTRYVLAAYDNGRTTIYRSNTKKLDDPQLSFEKVINLKFKQKDYSSLCLFTDINNNIYSAGFRSEMIDLEVEKIPSDDYVDLYHLNFKDSQFSKIDSEHMYTEHFLGPLGVHFRYGGGLRIKSSNELELYATQRNIGTELFYINKFEK